MAPTRNIMLELSLSNAGERILSQLEALTKGTKQVSVQVSGIDRINSSAKSLETLQTILDKVTGSKYEFKIAVTGVPTQGTVERVKAFTQALKELSDVAQKIPNLNLRFDNMNLGSRGRGVRGGFVNSSISDVIFQPGSRSSQVGKAFADQLLDGILNGIKSASDSGRIRQTTQEFTAKRDLNNLPLAGGSNSIGGRQGTSAEEAAVSRAYALLNEKLVGAFRLNQVTGRPEANDTLLQNLATQGRFPVELLKNRLAVSPLPVSDVSRLAQPEVLNQVAYGYLGGGLTGAAGAAGGALFGGAIGATTGGLALQVAAQVFTQVFGQVGEVLKEAADKGIVFEQSIQGIAAILQSNTSVSGLTGAQEIGAQQQIARNIQLQARAKLLPLGIGGEAESALVQSIFSGAGQRGITLSADQAATISQRFGAAIQLIRPDLTQNTSILRRDIGDIFSGTPQAQRTALSAAIRPVINQITEARTADELVKATDRLSAYVEAVQKSGLAAAQVQRIYGSLDQIQTQLGEGILQALAPSLGYLADVLQDPKLAKAAQFLGGVIGELASSFVIAADLVVQAATPLLSLTAGLQRVIDFGRGQSAPQSGIRPEARFLGELNKVGLDQKSLQSISGSLDQTPEQQSAVLSVALAHLSASSPEDFLNHATAAQFLQRETLRKAGSEISSRLSIGGAAGATGTAILNLAAAQQQRELILQQGQNNIRASKTALRYATEQANDQDSNPDQAAAAEQNLSDTIKQVIALRQQSLDKQRDLTKSTSDEVNALQQASDILRQNISLKQQAIIGIGPTAELAKIGIAQRGIPVQAQNLQEQIAALQQDINGGKLSNQESAARQAQIDSLQLQLNTLPAQQAELARQAGINRYEQGLASINTETISGQIAALRPNIALGVLQRGPEYQNVLEQQAVNRARGLQIEGLGTRLQGVRAGEALDDAVFSFKQHLGDLSDSLINAKRAVEDFSSAAELSQLKGKDRLVALAQQAQKEGVSLDKFGLPGDVAQEVLFGTSGISGDNRRARELQLEFRQAVTDYNRQQEDNAPGGSTEQRLDRGLAQSQRSLVELSRTLRDSAYGYAQTIVNLASKLDDDDKDQTATQIKQAATYIQQKIFGGNPLDNPQNSILQQFSALSPEGLASLPTSVPEAIAAGFDVTSLSQVRARTTPSPDVTAAISGRAGAPPSGGSPEKVSNLPATINQIREAVYVGLNQIFRELQNNTKDREGAVRRAIEGSFGG